MLFSNIRDDDGWLLGAGAAEDDLVGRDPLTVLTSEKTLLMACRRLAVQSAHQVLIRRFPAEMQMIFHIYCETQIDRFNIYLFSSRLSFLVNFFTEAAFTY